MDLVAVFVAHLRAGAPADSPELAAALAAVGHDLEASLVGRHGWVDHPAGYRCFAGNRPPDDARPGDVWMDRVEVMPMVLVEEPARGTARPPERAWLAMRPVARWQFRGFVDAATIVRREVQVEPTEPSFSPARLAGREAEPMTRVTPGESDLYAWYFGKRLHGKNQWEGAARTLADRGDSLWRRGHLEWTNDGCSIDDTLRVRIGATTWQTDPDDECAAELRGDEPDDDTRLCLGGLAFRDNTGLRTAIDTLMTEPGTLRSSEPIALDAVYQR
jgi:hypothetical protein